MNDPIVAGFEVETPYLHSTGLAVSRFLTALRDGQTIWGRRCDRCGIVVVPAAEYCETCGRDLGEWVRVGPEGMVEGFTIVDRPMPLAGLDPPFAFARIRLDGAGCDLIHLIAEVSALRPDVRVRPRWAAERIGSIRDIECFEVIG